MRDRDLFDELLENGLTPLFDPWRAPDYFFPFHRVTSEKFAKVDFTPAALPMPSIAEILTLNSVKDLTFSEDSRLLQTLLKS